MAKADFCFTYYDGDATRDMAHMNRLERGAYNDVIIQQRQRGHLSKDDLKKFLSKDFDAVWPALEWILKVDLDGKYFIEWLDNSEKKAAAHSKKQANNVSNRYQTSTNELPKNTLVIPLGDGDGNEEEDKDELKGGAGEKFLIPEMQEIFKKNIPSYGPDKKRDYEPLLSIAQFISSQTGPGLNKNFVIREWEKICVWIAQDPFYRTKALKSISNHIQEIIQKAKNGNSSSNGISKTLLTGNVSEGSFGKL